MFVVTPRKRARSPPLFLGSVSVDVSAEAWKVKTNNNEVFWKIINRGAGKNTTQLSIAGEVTKRKRCVRVAEIRDEER